jgi:hypothetical protein
MGFFRRLFDGGVSDYSPSPHPNPWDELHGGIEWWNEVPDLDNTSDTGSVIHHDISDKRLQLRKRLSDSMKSSASSEKERLAQKFKEWSDNRKIAKWVAEGWPAPGDGFDETQYHAEVYEMGGQRPARVIKHITLYSPYTGDIREVITEYDPAPSKW